MIGLRRAIRAVLLLLVAASATACAVPGQGQPGIAATYGDVVITNQEVIDARAALAALGTYTGRPGEPLTLLLLGDEFIAAAADRGFEPTPATIAQGALLWKAANLTDLTAPSDLEMRIVEIVQSVTFLAYVDGGLAEIDRIGAEAARGIVASPRYGPFTEEALHASLVNALTDATDRSEELQGAFFLVFKQVSGFADAPPSWIHGA